MKRKIIFILGILVFFTFVWISTSIAVQFQSKKDVKTSILSKIEELF